MSIVESAFVYLGALVVWLLWTLYASQPRRLDDEQRSSQSRTCNRYAWLAGYGVDCASATEVLVYPSRDLPEEVTRLVRRAYASGNAIGDGARDIAMGSTTVPPGQALYLVETSRCVIALVASDQHAIDTDGAMPRGSEVA